MRARGFGQWVGMALCIAFIAGPPQHHPGIITEFVNQFKSNPGQLIPSLDADARTVEATARDAGPILRWRGDWVRSKGHTASLQGCDRCRPWPRPRWPA